MYINKVHYPEFPENCFLKASYTGTQKYDTQYLGYDRQLPFLPKVALTAFFETEPIPAGGTGQIPDDQLPNAVDGLMQWWKSECSRGVDVFILKDIRLFGAVSNYGVRFITPLAHKVVDGGDQVSFTVEVLFDEQSLTNLSPTAIDMTLQIGENTRDNYVLLKGIDPELDGLTYEIVLPPAHGTIRESGRVILYTPFDGYKGDDCFNFVVKDRFNISKFATVGIAVGDTVHVDAEFLYTIDGNVDKFVVLGNYHWQYVDPTTNMRINYSTGETIKKPNNGSTNPWQLRIWSDDSEIAIPSLPAIMDIQVINWGAREYYAKFFADMPQLNALTTAGVVGTCQGVNFDHAFRNFPLDIPKIDMSHGIYFRNTFENTTGFTMTPLSFDEAKYCQDMFKGTKIKNIPPIILPKVDYAQDMFKSCDVYCLQGLDVTNAISTGGIMINSKFDHQPDAAIIAEFESNARRSFSGAKCGSVAGEITLTKRTNAVIPTYGAMATSKLEFTIHPQNTNGTVTYKWHSDHGTFTGGSDTTVKALMDIDTHIGDHNVSVWCDVIDSTGTVTTAKFSFIYKGVADYLELNIPKQTKPLNLKTYIDANNPSNKTEIYLLNNRINGQFITGALGSLNVVLHNTGEIQAFVREDGKITAPESAALIATSRITLINDGWIRACGGKGSGGAKGANTKHKKTVTDERYVFGCGSGYSWSDHSYSTTTTITWAGNFVNVQGHGGGPAKHPMYPDAEFFRGVYKASACCQTAGKFYSIKKVTYTWHTTVGGNGGLGGAGRGYLSPAKKGDLGRPSNPTGGNAGGKGGTGGDWGKAGGQSGVAGGKAIIGKSFLKTGSKTGNCSGAIT